MTLTNDINISTNRNIYPQVKIIIKQALIVAIYIKRTNIKNEHSGKQFWEFMFDTLAEFKLLRVSHYKSLY